MNKPVYLRITKEEEKKERFNRNRKAFLAEVKRRADRIKWGK